MKKWIKIVKSKLKVEKLNLKNFDSFNVIMIFITFNNPKTSDIIINKFK